MAIIPITNTFTFCPEGTHIFRIYKVDYNEEFGKLTVYLVNAQGITMKENFFLMNDRGEPNEGACTAFSLFAKTALNNTSLVEVDPATLVDHYIKSDVVHTVLPSTNDKNKTVTFVNLGRNKEVANGFDTTPVPKALTLGHDTNVATTPVAQPTPAPAQTTGLDLNALLNG